MGSCRVGTGFAGVCAGFFVGVYMGLWLSDVGVRLFVCSFFDSGSGRCRQNRARVKSTESQQLEPQSIASPLSPRGLKRFAEIITTPVGQVWHFGT